MTNSAKKLISLLLTAIMLFGVIPAVGINAEAETVITETESNNDYASADTIYINSDVSGKLSGYEDLDYFKFVPNSNGKLEFKFNHSFVDDSGKGWNISLYYYDNSNYNKLYETDIYLNANESIDLPTIGAVCDGAYYIVISSAYWDCAVGYEYNIVTSFTETENYEKEVNDSYNSANIFGFNDIFAGTLNNYEDKDFYKIVPNSNGKLEFKFNHSFVDDSGKGWNISIYYYDNSNYNKLYETDIYLNANESIDLPSIGAVRDGAYYIVISSAYWDCAVGYEYNIETSFTETENYEKEINDSYNSANIFSHNDTFAGTLSNYEDKDFYKIVPNSNGKLEFIFNHGFVDDGEKGWNISLYYYNSSNYNKLFETDIYLNANESIDLPSIGAVRDGAYYIVISSAYWDCAVGYEYNIETSFTETEDFEKEINNSYQTANIISKGIKYSGNTTSDSDTDYFRYDAQKSENITVTFEHSYKDSWNEWNVTFFKYASGAYTELENVYVSVGDTIESKEIYTLNAIKGTTYFIRITGSYDLATYEYSFILGNEPVVIPEYTLTYNANGGSGAPAAQTGSTSYIIPSTVPARSGYTFLGWSESSKATTATYSAGQTINLTKNTVLYAVWKKDETPVTPPETWYTCPYCGGKFNDYSKYESHINSETSLPDADIDIRTPSTTTINYGDSIVLHADVKNLPAGGYVEWSVNNANFSVILSSDRSTVTVSPMTSGDTVFTATIYDANGNELDSDTQTMTSKAGFFQKIIAFFKKLFGMTKVIPQFAKI